MYRERCNAYARSLLGCLILHIAYRSTSTRMHVGFKVRAFPFFYVCRGHKVMLLTIYTLPCSFVFLLRQTKLKTQGAVNGLERIHAVQCAWCKCVNVASVKSRSRIILCAVIAPCMRSEPFLCYVWEYTRVPERYYIYICLIPPRVLTGSTL